MTSTPDNSSVIVLHSARSEGRTYVLNTAHMSHWSDSKSPAGCTVWMVAGDPLVVKEEADEVTALFMGYAANVTRVKVTARREPLREMANGMAARL